MDKLDDYIKQYIEAHRDEFYDKETNQLTLAGCLFVILTTCKVFGLLGGDK